MKMMIEEPSSIPVGEDWCGWFFTPICTNHALTVYLHSTFTVPPIGDTFGI